jgi:hypothetical protein
VQVARAATPAILAVLALLLGLLGDRVMPAVLIAGLTLLCTGQLVHSLRR